MIHTHTEWGRLREVIVGRELELPHRIMDTTFRAFYASNIRHTQFAAYDEYKISADLIQERIEDLDGLANILASLGVTVLRPDSVTKSVPFTTPEFKSLLSSASNVRDLTLTYRDMIIETPPLIRGRYFENRNMHQIFKRHFYDGSKWLRAPDVLMTSDSFDSEEWDNPRDFDHIDFARWDLGIDAAQYLKLGQDVFCNISTYNHHLGARWVEQILGPDVNIHMIDSMVDNHLDGNILPLRPGVFLVNESALEKPIKEYLPQKFHNWTFINSDNGEIKVKNYDNQSTPFVQLCSYRGMDMNVLSVDENTVLVNDDAHHTIRVLEEAGFNAIPVRLRHCELFGGGIHCSTLDTVRDDEFIDYTK
jgi:glycine amidinotransferase